MDSICLSHKQFIANDCAKHIKHYAIHAKSAGFGATNNAAEQNNIEYAAVMAKIIQQFTAVPDQCFKQLLVQKLNS